MDDKLSAGATFLYFELKLRLISEQFATLPEASILAKHVQEKAKKEIKQANSLAKKLAKSQEKYKGVDFPEKKEVEELKGVLRAYMGRTGTVYEIPNTVPELLELAEEVKKEFEGSIDKDQQTATVFMRDETGHAIISSHMILGNLKENLRIITNNGDKSVAPSKVSVGEMGALDIKVVEPFLKPSNDVVKNAEGQPQYYERPIVFTRMAEKVAAIALSEFLPVGTEYKCTLRIRKDSPLAQMENLTKLLDCGKNNGIGQWRGSGGKGAYAYQLKELKNFSDPRIPDGWN